jgi:DNA repair protein RadC
VTKDSDKGHKTVFEKQPLWDCSIIRTCASPIAGAENLDRAAHDATGHRTRLRKRLLDGGEGALADHEMIEYLLMLAIPRRDTKPLARSLLARFGTLAGVFNADPAALAHPGMGETSAAAMRIVALAARRLARHQMAETLAQFLAS